MSRTYAISEYIMHAPGLLHIGVAAYFVWASPPNGGCTALLQASGVHGRRRPVEYPTVADAVIEAGITLGKAAMEAVEARLKRDAKLGSPGE
jgi:hypothetical protein